MKIYPIRRTFVLRYTIKKTARSPETMLYILLFTFFSALFSQPSTTAPVERWLVQVHGSDSRCLSDWWEQQRWAGNSYPLKALPVDGWWVMVAPAGYKERIAQLPCVSKVAQDRKIENRDTQPNDPAFINQKDMTLIGMAKAWDISTGGVTAQGDTIVVAIIDDGYQIDHEDLIGNIWINHREIPGDGIDNDGNGYKDDYLGLNVNLGNDQHPVKSHGSSVCGIIGAKGNNGKGVTGVNWNVKLMLISPADFESRLIESYQYVLDMRKRYRQSGGTEGAFVVATSTSGGVDGALAQDHPMWCAMYDKLGAEGILSVCAAPNNPISVDVEGDMPTTCTSPYMIAVTNVDLTDQLVANAGFGSVSIDMGAPGHGTITVASGNQYKEFNGTSAATPHVAGAIGLIYSTTCSSFLYDLPSNPAGTASRVRDLIFSTGKINNSLSGLTVHGKRLQADAALRSTVTDCEEIPESGIQIFSIRPNPSSLNDAFVYFEVKGDTANAYFEVYNMLGARVYQFPIRGEDFDRGYIRIQTGPLPAGIYLVTLRNQKEKVTQKLLIL